MAKSGGSARTRSKGDIVFKSVLTPSNITSSSSQQPPIVASSSSRGDRPSSPATVRRIALSTLPPSQVTPLPVHAGVLWGEGYAAGAYVRDSPSVLHYQSPSSIICQLSRRFSADTCSLSRCKICSTNSSIRATNRIRSRLPPNSSTQQSPTTLLSATARYSRDSRIKKPPRSRQLRRQRAESSRPPPKRATERYGGRPGFRAPPCSSTSRGKEASTTGCLLHSAPRNKDLDDIETSTSRYGAFGQSPWWL